MIFPQWSRLMSRISTTAKDSTVLPKRKIYGTRNHTIFVLCDELLTAMHIQEDTQIQMNNAEVMTVPLTAARFSMAIRTMPGLLHEHGYIPGMLSESRLNRRIHGIPEGIWLTVFGFWRKPLKP